MGRKITLDRKTFKVLASDTRINILKKLDERQQTLTDLVEEFDMSPSTIKEHLDKLVSAGLIKQIDEGMKWKYYQLTRKGENILNPYEKKVWIILTTALIGLFASLYNLFFDLEKLAQPVMLPAEQAYEGVQRAAEGKKVALGEKIISSTTTTLQTMAEKVTQTKVPYSEIVVVLVLVLIIGISTGYLIKKGNVFL